MAEIPEGWAEVDGALERTFEAPTYLAGAKLVAEIAEAAEAANHHPDLLLTWRRVKVRWSSHDVGGISDRDRTLAAKTNELASSSWA